MRHPIILILTALPLFGVPKPFSGGLSAPVLKDSEVVALASIIYCECRGESELGRIFVADVVRNRAAKKGETIEQTVRRGFDCYGEADSASLALAREVLKRKPVHQFHYFFNPKTATDKKWLRYGLSQVGFVCGRHFFF